MLTEVKNQVQETGKSDELFILAKRSNDAKLREKLSALDNPVDIFVAGLFQGLCEALATLEKKQR